MNACLTPLVFSSLEFGYPGFFIQLLSEFSIFTCRSATMETWITESESFKDSTSQYFPNVKHENLDRKMRDFQTCLFDIHLHSNTKS